MIDWEKYTFQPEKVEDLLKKDFTIVVDTNVLLAIYQWKDVTAESILESLIKLNSEERLKIPSHGLLEFSRNRTNIITSAINEVSQVQDGIGSTEERIRKDLTKKLPMLMNDQKLDELLMLQSEAFNHTRKYKNELLKLSDSLKEYFFNDPHLETIKTLLNDKSILKNSKEDSKLEEEFKERLKANIPPGNKDANKNNNNSQGDYKIWESILTIENNVIFVTADNKNDWCHTDNKKNILSARRELIEEFWVHTKKTFSIIHPKDFFVMYNPKLSEEVIDDLSGSLSVMTNDTVTKSRLKKFSIDERLKKCELLSRLLHEYDPVGIIELSNYNEDVYYSEAKEINDTLMGLKYWTYNDLEKTIKGIFEDNFDFEINLDSKLDREMIRKISDLYSHTTELGNTKIIYE